MTSLAISVSHVAGPAYDVHLVRRLAKSIRASCEQGACIPFDPWRASRTLGATVRVTAELKDTLGRLRVSRDSIVIDLRRGESHRRHRFTLSHELAHLCFLDASLELDSRAKETYLEHFQSLVRKREEYLCNAIAAELLMPRNVFSRLARRLRQMHGRLDVSACAQLADHFLVTREAARCRVQELRIRRVARAHPQRRAHTVSLQAVASKQYTSSQTECIHEATLDCHH